MIEEKERINAGKMVWGIVLILVGLLLALDRLGMIEVDDLWRFWPMVMVLLGVANLTIPRSPADRGSGIWLLLIGLWLQINLVGLFGLGWGNSWPLLIVAIGLAMVLGGLFPKLSPEGKTEDAEK